MNNSGDETLIVPGFNGLPLEDELPTSERFAHGFGEWKQVPAITLREFTITSVINTLTDKQNWYKDVFRPEIVHQWYTEFIISTPLLSENTWEWCVAELKDKAKDYEEKGFVQVLDTGSCVCKSDRPEVQSLCAELQTGLKPFLHGETMNSGEIASGVVQTYVDPWRYPLVYGKSRVLVKGGHVSRDGSISSEQNSSFEQAPVQENKQGDVDGVQQRINPEVKGRAEWTRAEGIFRDISWDLVPNYYWSYKYQCLPSDVIFSEGSDTGVKLTSYVNGLRPENNDGLYTSLEKLISMFIEPWNNCLIKGKEGWKELFIKLDINGFAPAHYRNNQRGRVPCRIITYGAEWENEAPEWFKNFDKVRRSRIQTYQKRLAAVEEIKKEKPPKGSERRTRIKHRLRIYQAEDFASQYQDMKGAEQLPEPSPELWERAIRYLVQDEPGLVRQAILPSEWWDKFKLSGSTPELWEEAIECIAQAFPELTPVQRQSTLCWKTLTLLKIKNRRMLHVTHPEPGTAFTYEEWRGGLHGGKANVDMVTDRPIVPDKTPPITPHQPYKVSLQSDFREKGLQIIIRVEGIELTPEKPVYPGDVWDLKGQKNEHIVAVGVYVYDVYNVTESSIAFRQETSIGHEFFQDGQFLFQGLGEQNLYTLPESGKWKDWAGALSEIFGFDKDQMLNEYFSTAMPIQEMGKVALPQGRAVAFPNTMESRREPFRLQDSTKNGHHRMVTVMLVDPNYRICSTRNVPPQQPDSDEDTSNYNEKFGNEYVGRVVKEMTEEHRRMHYARYASMRTFWLS